MLSRENRMPATFYRSAAVIAAAGALLLAADKIPGCNGGGGPDPTITPGATLERMQPTTDIGILEMYGQASASAYDDSRVPGFVPFVGGDKVPGTDKSESVTANGLSELRIQQGGIQYSPYELPGGKGYGTKVNVKSELAYMRLSMSTLFKKDGPQVGNKRVQSQLPGRSACQGHHRFLRN